MTLSTMTTYAEPIMPNKKYLIYFNVNNSVCYAYINGFEAFYNEVKKGPIASGGNATPYLINGENKLVIKVAGLGAFDGDSTYPSDASCQLRLTEATEDSEVEIASVIATANQELRPTGITTPKIDGTSISEYQLEGKIVYDIENKFIIDGIPKWTWTTATPFEDNPENMAKLKQAYQQLQTLILNHDSDGIQKMAQISFSEQETAEGLEPGDWYKSMDFFERKLDRVAQVRPMQWEDFKLISVNDGKLVKLAFRGNPPSAFLDSEGNYLFNYAPYFSLINGEIVITR